MGIARIKNGTHKEGSKREPVQVWAQRDRGL
jgi:hypothetical protein